MKRLQHALTIAFTLGGIAAAFAAEEIRIGQTLPYSGPVSGFGLIGKTQEAFFDKVNAEGGINGRKVKFITLDDTYSPPKTRSSCSARWALPPTTPCTVISMPRRYRSSSC
jgi:branched-chain amino acid transport system substrate-binding protein